MRIMKSRLVKSTTLAFLLGAAASSGAAFSSEIGVELPESGGTICGSWEWVNGTNFVRWCCNDANQCWREYMTIKLPN